MSEPSDTRAYADLVSGDRKEPIWLPVLSGSMSPCLIPGDRVLVEPCSWKRCLPGEIIVFRKGFSLTAHRLIFKRRFFLKILVYQQGDAMNRGEYITPDHVVGHCLRRKRGDTDFPLNDLRENRKIVRTLRVKRKWSSGKRVIKRLLKKIHIFPWL